jgi:hypothetical protein
VVRALLPAAFDRDFDVAFAFPCHPEEADSRAKQATPDEEIYFDGKSAARQLIIGAAGEKKAP